MSDLPTWARVLVYAAGAIAAAVVLYAVVFLAVRAALRTALAEHRASSRRQEDLLRGISTSAEYVADVADAWAEAEAERRGVVSAPTALSPPDEKAESPASEGHDHAGTA